MDDRRFDDFTRQFGLRRSRRSLMAGLAGVMLARSIGHRSVSAQDDQETGTPAPIEPTPVTEDSNLEEFPCLPIVQCKTCENSMLNNEQICMRVGDIPGGPYEQEWCWSGRDCIVPRCRPKDKSMEELSNLCNETYPEKGNIFNLDCRRGCCPAPIVNVIGC